ncbi:MAG: DUF819 domain-containing protein [Planctomycetota bacterium]|nr:MAG: DUF819 domain-containing protein [Planctomycetota bacterium]
MTLFQPDDTWLLWMVIVVGVAASIYLEQAYRWAARLSGPVLALCIAMVLANLRVMPPESPVYDTIIGHLVPLALPLLLFRGNVFKIIRTTGWLFVAFHLSAVGTVVGAITAALVLRNHVPDMAHVAAIMTGSYTGGGVNFYAVASSYDVPSNVMNPLIVADNFIMAGMFITLLLVCRSDWAKRWYPHPHTADAVDSRALAAEHWKRKEISLLDIAASLGVAVTVVAVANLTARLVESLPAERTPASVLGEVLSNEFLHITAWATLVATVFHRSLERVRGAEEMGAYLLYLFLFTIGLPADLWLVLSQVPMMFVFCLMIALANLVVTFVGGRLLKLNLEDLALSVNATLGGAPSAAALAISMGWSKLVLPALLIGVWGYTIGTAIGLLVGELLSTWL